MSVVLDLMHSRARKAACGQTVGLQEAMYPSARAIAVRVQIAARHRPAQEPAGLRARCRPVPGSRRGGASVIPNPRRSEMAMPKDDKAVSPKNGGALAQSPLFRLAL
jgi:hypothetical protein